jgi:hypothetical protein
LKRELERVLAIARSPFFGFGFGFAKAFYFVV